MKTFIALDVETANAWMGSICQIGMVEFRDGEVIDEWKTLVDPRCEFDAFNVMIHGITEDDVEGAPTFLELQSELGARLGDNLIACYGHFDRAAFQRAGDHCGIAIPGDGEWLNLHRVVRRAWPEKYAKKGWALNKVCTNLGIILDNHHDALADAKAAGHVFLHAIEAAGVAAGDWATHIKVAAKQQSNPLTDLEPDPNGHFWGESAVFTGALSMPRREAAKLAAEAGCKVTSNVTKQTTLLIVGDQDISKVGADGKSGKHLKAIQLIEAGQPLRIIGETDFAAAVKLV